MNDFEKNKNGDANPRFNISTQANLSDSRKPVREALRYSYQSSIYNSIIQKKPCACKAFSVAIFDKVSRNVLGNLYAQRHLNRMIANETHRRFMINNNNSTILLS